jgi:hypothetical protein
MNSDLWWIALGTSSGCGSRLMLTLVRLWAVTSATGARHRLKPCGNQCLQSIANVPSSIVISGRLTQSWCQACGIVLWVKKLERQATLNGSTAPYDNECRDWSEKHCPSQKSWKITSARFGISSITTMLLCHWLHPFLFSTTQNFCYAI